jgi:hypothetical protein
MRSRASNIAAAFCGPAWSRTTWLFRNGPAPKSRLKSPEPLTKAVRENPGAEELLPQYDTNTCDIYYSN